MRLCIVQTVLPLYAISFFNRIVERNSDIELVVLADLQSSEALNQYQRKLCRFQVKQLGQRSLYGVSLRSGILNLLRQVDADIVVFSGSPREPCQLLAMVWLRLLGKPVAMWGMFHRIGGPRLISTLFYRIVGKLAHRCLSYTRVGASNLVSLGVSKQKIDVIGTAIDEQVPLVESATRTAEQLATFRRQLGLDGKQLVLQVVRLTRVKNPELLVQAALLVLSQRQDIVFALVGDGEMRAELQSMVQKLGLAEHFRFPGAIYDEAQLSRWYLSARVFVVPTFMGLSAHHAMSYGLPVVTDDSLDCQGSEFEILAPGLNSLTYSEGDVNDLARVLIEILEDSALHGMLSTNALHTVTHVHNLDKKTRRFMKCIRELGTGVAKE
jgi:glycosyltransferase involved in cell wall biosynthesis